MLPPEAAAKVKEAKPAAERKRARNLSEDKRFKLFSGTANKPLTEEIGRHIGVPVGEVKIQRFADGEVSSNSLRMCAEWMCSWSSPPATRWTRTWWNYWS